MNNNLGILAGLSSLAFWHKVKGAKTSRSVDVARAITEQRARFNPLRNFTPERLVRAIDNWRIGTLCDLARILEELEQRDDMIIACSQKMKASVSRCKHSVQIVEGQEDNPVAQQHKKTLEDFWANIRTSSVFCRNERGGFRLLVKQMMDAFHAKYAVHEIVWEPHRDGTIRARFQFVPLWMFENHTGELRYLDYYGAYDGIPMEPGEWMVTVGEGVGIAAAVAAMSKRLSLNDWLLFSEKCGIPGLHAKTGAPEGSEEWEKLVDALRSFGKDWAVVTGMETEVDTVSLANSGQTPYPELVKAMNKAICVLYRGADLSTQSGEGGDANGASLQGEESDILEQDACEMLSETLQEQVEKFVIEYVYGKGVRPLAYIQIEPNAKEDAKLDMEIDNHLMDAGVSLSKNDMLQRYGRTEYKPEDANDAPVRRQTPQPSLLGPDGRPLPPSSAQVDDNLIGRRALANENGDENARRAAWVSLQEDLKDALSACEKALSANDEAGLIAALKKLPKTADGHRLAAQLKERMKARLANANWDDADHPRGKGGRFIKDEGVGRVAEAFNYEKTEGGAYKLDRHGKHVYARDAIKAQFKFGKKFGEVKAKPCPAWDRNKADVPFNGKRLFSEMSPDEVYVRGDRPIDYGGGKVPEGKPKYEWMRGGRNVPSAEAVQLEEAVSKRISGQLLTDKASSVRVRADYANGENQIAQYIGGTGKPKTEYDAATEAVRQKAKFEQVEDICAKYDELFSGVAEGCRKGVEEAEVAYFLMRTKCRIGGSQGKKNDNYGALDLTGEHVKVSGDKITIEFDAKNAHWRQTVTDKRLAGILSERMGKATNGGRIFSVREAKVNNFLTRLGDEAGVIKNADGKGFTAHNIRHAGATRLAEKLVDRIKVDPKKDENAYLRELEKVVTECARHICDTPKTAFDRYIAPQVLFKRVPWMLEKRWRIANELGFILPESSVWSNTTMEKMRLANNAPNAGEDGFIMDENPDEGWEVTPLDPNGSLDYDKVYGDDDDDDEDSFYTEEDYENCPVLRVMMRDLGGEDPLGREYADIGGKKE